MYKCALFCLFFIMTKTVLLSQSLDIISFRYSAYPIANIQEAGDSVEIGIQEIEAGINLPFRIGTKMALIAGIYYAEVISSSNRAELNNDLHFLALNILGSYSFSDQTSLQFLLYPALSSTLTEPIDSDDFQIFGGAVLSRKVNEKITLGVGAVYTPRLGRPLVLPVIRFNYFNDNFSLQTNIPQFIQAQWNTSGRVIYGMKMALSGSQFQLPDNASIQNNDVEALNFSRVQLGPELEINLKNNIYFTLFGGVVANRTFNFSSDGGSVLQNSIANTGFISANFSFKIKPNSK